MAGVAVLVDAVTDGDGIAMVDHPIANFVAGHRAQVLTSAMKVASSAGGPLGMSALAVVAGVLLSVAWRSAMPAIVLAVTGAGVAALAQVFKVALGRARPPLAQAAATAPGYSFPSGHAAAAAAILGATAWLLSMRVRSWRGRTAIWSCAAMLAALIGISRVFLGVHWTTDVIGGWVFGIAWLAVVVCCLAAFGLTPMARSPTEARGTR